MTTDAMKTITAAASEIEQTLDAGLGALGDLLAARAKHDDNAPGQADEWLILGRFWLDRFGQVWKSHGPPVESLPRVVPWEFAPRAWSFSPASLPRPEHRCSGCGKGWTVDTAHDYIWTHASNSESGETERAHLACRQAAIDVREHAYFREIAETAGLDPATMRAVPNQYGSESYAGQWHEIASPIGPITIGWRKHVISISWTQDGPDGGRLFADEQVTCGPTNVHAWTRENAIRYLTTLVGEAP